MNNEYEKIDFFIPLHRYHPLFQSCIEAVIKFYHPRTIYIVTSILSFLLLLLHHHRNVLVNASNLTHTQAPLTTTV